MSAPRPIYNEEAERAVLGAVLLSGDALADCGSLAASDFYLQTNAWVWQAINSAAARGAVDIITVHNEMKRLNYSEEVGGPAYLAGLLENAFSFNAKQYAEIVRAQSRRRGLLALASDIAKSAYDEKSDLNEHISRFMERLGKNINGAAGAVHVSEFVKELRAEISAAVENPRDIFGMSTGLRDLDEVTGGLQVGEMFVLSGKSGKGKSLLAGQLGFSLAHAMSAGGAPGAVYALEMKGRAVVRRQLSGMTGIKTRLMRTGRVDDASLPNLVYSLNLLETDYRLFMSDTATYTTATLRADLARLAGEHGVKWFVLDYLEKLKDEHNGDDWQRSARLSDRVHDICTGLDIHGVVIQRTNKAGLGAEATGAEHLSGSAQIIFDADLVGVLNDFIPADESERGIPDAQRANLVTLTFPKVREDAPRRYVHLVRKPGIPAFADYINDNRATQTPASPNGAARRPASAGYRPTYPND